MLKGHTGHSSIAGTLRLAGSTAVRRMEEVRIRWDVLGNPSGQRRARGEALQRLRLIEQKLWAVIDGNPDDQTALAAIAQLIEIHDRMITLNGLTPKVMERMDTSGVRDGVLVEV